METNNLSLSTEQLLIIAGMLIGRIEDGLKTKDQEIKCLLTYINPKKEIKSSKCLVIDWGGTNLRVAIVEFDQSGEPKVEDFVETLLSAEVIKEFEQKYERRFKREDLFNMIVAEIKKLKTIDENINEIKMVGYCFSYPAESYLYGDAELIEWTKGIDIVDMKGSKNMSEEEKKEILEGKENMNIVGQPLLEYLNKNIKNANFEKIAVINDTVAALLGGISKTGYDAYMGLIVGTGTNTATTMSANGVVKKDTEYNGESILINTESGGFDPSPFLTDFDDCVDSDSDNKGRQRFEKAISGKYLSEIFKKMFPDDEFKGDTEKGFHTGTLNHMVNCPSDYEEKYIVAARCLFDRSAKLVAASLAGLIFVLKTHNKELKKVFLTAEGKVFWCEDKMGTDYNKVVERELYRLLAAGGYSDITVKIDQIEKANLIGSAIAALSLV